MNSKKALIVDDSRLAQFVLKKMLIEQKMDVDTSESAEDALGYLKQHTPDVIFLDHSMPGMNGLEALKVIKNNPTTAPIPVMMYTSQEDSAYMAQAKALGAIDVLPKQLTTADLQQVLDRLELDKNTVHHIANAANEPRIDSKTQHESSLEVLIKDAESALTPDVIEQQFQRKLKQQRDSFEEEITLLHEKINALIPAAENSSNRQNFWNNIFWSTIYCITVISFVAVYFQQKATIEQLTEQTQTIISAPQQLPSNAQQNISLPAIADDTINEEGTDNKSADTNRLIALENLLNTNNQIPTDELLLGETVLTSINELIPSLEELNFSGQVAILAHDGRFCLSTNSNGQFEMAADDVTVSQCQINEASDRLADIASIDLLRAITASNQTPGRAFVITLDSQGSNQPLENYPAPSGDVAASEWNAIALKNRRVEIQLKPIN